VTSFIVLFSGGIASWAAARRLVDQHGTDSVTLLFTDTMTEDADLYRFLDEAAADIGAPLVRIADGRDIWQVFKDQRMLGNSRIDPCSAILKRNLSRRWLDEHAPDATLVFGYDWTELHRFERTATRWAPRAVLAPLTEPPYRLRADWMADLNGRGIRTPRLYDLGFSHNNCGGGCVKAGAGHFTHLYRTLPDVYAQWEQNEQQIRDHLGRDVAILRSWTGDRGPLTLAQLRERIDAGDVGQEQLWDVAGCDCFGEP
jgi:hypothetical protein